MNRLNFDPEMDPSVLQHVAYNSNYTESINKQMRVPDTITVAQSTNSSLPGGDYFGNQTTCNNVPGNPALNMEVPDRIIMSVGESGIQYKQGETKLPSSTFPDETPASLSPLALKTPPRVLTLQDHSLDALDINNSKSEKLYADESSSSGMGNSSSDQLSLSEPLSLETLDNSVLMRKQIFKLHRRITALEQAHTSRLHREYVIYGMTAAFWLLNGWFLYYHRRLY